MIPDWVAMMDVMRGCQGLVLATLVKTVLMGKGKRQAGDGYIAHSVALSELLKHNLAPGSSGLRSHCNHHKLPRRNLFTRSNAVSEFGAVCCEPVD